MACPGSSIPAPAAELSRAFFASSAIMQWSEHDAVFEPAYDTKEAIWDLLVRAPVQTHADAAGKLAAVLRWIDDGNAERADGSDRAMLGEVLAFLRGH